jgi:predicted Rossmann fold flavoprotein
MKVSEKPVVLIAGGGAAGFFAAIHVAELLPDAQVILIEKSSKILSKVRVSGGGRCNTTHACFDIKQLITYYPRGGKSLLGPFAKFSPADTVEWFKQRGVRLKTEHDGRMFPVTDNSETIIRCLYDSAVDAGVEIRLSCGLSSIHREGVRWIIDLDRSSAITADALLIATGSTEQVWKMLKAQEIAIVDPVPSLFTLHIPDKRLHELSGASVAEVNLTLESSKLKTNGPLLITHWGFSGPATLKLSAWAARELAASGYKGYLKVNWIPETASVLIQQLLLDIRKTHSRKLPRNTILFSEIPKRIWEYLLSRAGIEEHLNWADLSNRHLNKLQEELTAGRYEFTGKSTFKEEFVTCGGVNLNEINLKTMECKKLPGLFFCGEVADVDAVTGGFNFQWAWTSAYLAAEGAAARVTQPDTTI